MNPINNNDIAIIGMAGLFPKAPNFKIFWSNILNKVNAVGQPMPEWGADIFLDSESRAVNRIYTSAGGFLNELSEFDGKGSGIMPVSLYGGQPDQFLSLKLAVDALKDAGYDENKFDAKNTGIILGHSVHAHRGNTSGVQHCIVLDQTVGLFKSLFPDISKEGLEKIEETLLAQLPPLSVDAVPGLVPNMMTGRIANRLNLMGPNYVVDAACASSTVAMEMAMLELQQGRANMMLAGGINTTTSPMVYMVFCQIEALSRSSRIQPFGDQADGTLLGEGGGVLLLKRLSDAIKDQNRIYAIIKSVGQASDGRGKGLMAPRFEGQVLALQRAYENAHIPPETVGLLEAHGTGIPLGDETEIQALLQVMGQRRGRFPHCALGTVKSMIGHAIPAAGSAGVIKAALALYHKILPPTLCEKVNPRLGIEKSPFYINTEMRPWVHGGNHPRRAGVNAFGFGGINNHVILEEAPVNVMPEAFGLSFQGVESEMTELFLFCHENRQDLLNHLNKFGKRLAKEDRLPLAQLASELWQQCGVGPQRAALVAKTRVDLIKKMELLAKKLVNPELHDLKAKGGVYFCDRPLQGKLAFLFPGEGSQYPGMLKELLLRFPVMRRWFDFLDRLFGKERSIVPSMAVFSPSTSITAEETKALDEALYKMDLGSESVFVADQAIFALLSSFGLSPRVMVGHSTGETSALLASGIPQMREKEVGEYIYEMNRMYKKLQKSGAIPEGVLMSVGGVDRVQIEELLSGDKHLLMTMDNCIHQTILFGSPASIESAMKVLKAEGGICVELPFGRAYHTEFMAPMADAFKTLFKDIQFVHDNEIELYSCATKSPFPKEREAFLETIAKQYMTRVHFRETIERMYDDGVRFFVEVGPNGHLTSFVKDILTDKAFVAVASNLHRRKDLNQIQHLLAALFVQQLPMNLKPLYESSLQDKTSEIDDDTIVPLPNHLPFIRFSEEKIAEIRKLLPTPPPHVSHTHKTLSGSRNHKIMHNHFQLMNQFLKQQGKVLTTGLTSGKNRRLVSEKIEEEVVLKHGLSVSRHQFLSLPFHAVLQFIPPKMGHFIDRQLKKQGIQGLLNRFLDASEILMWPPVKNPRRRAEWVLGRLAVKEAVKEWLEHDRGMTIDLTKILLKPDSLGKPFLVGNQGDFHGAPPSVSLAHSSNAALAIAGPPDIHLGVDLERMGRISVDQNSFEEVAFTPSERLYLSKRDNWEKIALFLWTAKEAAAKALGTGLTVNPRAFAVEGLSIQNNQARIRYKDQLMDVHWHVDGEYICAVVFSKH